MLHHVSSTVSTGEVWHVCISGRHSTLNPDEGQLAQQALTKLHRSRATLGGFISAALNQLK